MKENFVIGDHLVDLDLNLNKGRQVEITYVWENTIRVEYFEGEEAIHKVLEINPDDYHLAKILK